MTYIQSTFDLLSCAIFDTEVSIETKNLIKDSVNLKNILYLSKKHDVAHLIAYALLKNNYVKDKKLKEKLLKEINIATFRYQNSQEELENITKILSLGGIEFIPLKGAVIRNFYREPWMRTSCDLDVLIKEKDKDKSVELLVEKLSYKAEKPSFNEISLYSPSLVHLELHFSLQERAKPAKALENIFNKVIVEEGYLKKLTPETLLFYHVYHASKHLESGGMGIKPIMDLAVILTQISWEEEKLNALLSEEGYLVFFNEILRLSKIWFGKEKHTDLTVRLEEFILNGGVYGTLENRVLVQQSKQGGKKEYLKKRIFISNEELKEKYPVLKNKTWLIPFYHIKRWFKPLFNKESRDSSFAELYKSNKIDNVKLNKASKLLEDLGLK